MSSQVIVDIDYLFGLGFVWRAMVDADFALGCDLLFCREPTPFPCTVRFRSEAHAALLEQL